MNPTTLAAIIAALTALGGFITALVALLKQLQIMGMVKQIHANIVPQAEPTPIQKHG